MHACIAPYRNFKDCVDLKGENQAHDSVMADISAILFNTTQCVLQKIPCLRNVAEKFDRIYEVSFERGWHCWAVTLLLNMLSSNVNTWGTS